MTLWTVACHTPLSMGFSPGKNTGVGCHFLLQAIFLTQQLNPHVLTFPALAGRFLPLVPPGKPLFQCRSPLIVIAWDPGPRQFPALPYPEVSELSVLPYFYLYSVSKAPGGNRVCCPFPRDSEKAMATHSSTLAWKIPWTEEPGRLQSMGSLRVGHD